MANHQPCGDKERCKFFDLPSGCRNVDNCAFLHPGQEEVLQVPVCRFYKTPTGCRYGESCKFVHDGSPKIEGTNEDKDPVIEKVEFGGKTYELENGRIRGPSSYIGVILPQEPTNRDKTPIKCGECGMTVNGQDELYNHYYVRLIEMKVDHTKIFQTEKTFKGNHQCNRCGSKYTDYMVYLEHMTRQVSSGCYSHWKNLDDMVERFVLRDVNKISCQATLKAIRDTSNEYETVRRL